MGLELFQNHPSAPRGQKGNKKMAFTSLLFSGAPTLLLCCIRPLQSLASGTWQRHSQDRVGGRLGSTSQNCQLWKPEFLGREPSLTQTHRGHLGIYQVEAGIYRKSQAKSKTPYEVRPLHRCRALASGRKGRCSTKIATHIP